jgi:GH18 family chitinase
MNKLIAVILLVLSINAFADNNPINFAYVEVNDHSLTNPGCYVRADNHNPFFQIVSIFAANINGDNPNEPVIYFNPQVDQILNHSTQVATLQKKGIKVVLTLLGNHQNAGWSCMTDETAIQNFANNIVNTINQYKLDGVDIDDEYSNCYPNNTSMIRIAKAIKSNPKFQGKILSEALFDDESYFSASYQGKKLADFLDLGSEMTYGSSDFNGRLQPYVGYGMKKNKLGIGLDIDASYPSPTDAANFILKNGYGELMIYNVSKYSATYLNQLSKVEYSTTIEVLPACLSDKF